MPSGGGSKRSSARDWRDRAHFLAVAATAMRSILVDRARGRFRAKRGHGQAPVTLAAIDGLIGAEPTDSMRDIDVLWALDGVGEARMGDGACVALSRTERERRPMTRAADGPFDWDRVERLFDELMALPPADLLERGAPSSPSRQIQ